GQVLPDLRLMYVAGRPHVGVNVDEAGDDRLAAHVNHLGAGGEGGFASARRPYLGDAVVGDDDVALLDHLIAAPRDAARARQYDHAFRFGARGFDHDVEALRFVGASLSALIDRLAIELRAPRPGDRFAVARPRDVIAAFGRHLLHRNRRRSTDDAH